MKYIYTIIFVITTHLAFSQAITYTENIKHSECEGSNNGLAEITVTSTNGPYSYLWSTGATTNFIEDLAPANYSVTITNTAGDTLVLPFMIIEMECNFQADLYFTPNGDGINDVWGIAGLSELTDVLVIIYNRLGQKVFESKGAFTPWDGKDLFKKPVPDATYYYVIYSNKKNNKPNAKGSVTIIR